jgi:hypothetical protein
MLLVLLVILVVLMVAGVPQWGYPHAYGYWPSGVLGVVLVVLVVLLLLGRL